MDNLNICKINRASVREQLQDLSSQYLTDARDEYLNMFVSEVKRIADNALDDYIHEQEDLYLTDEICGIKDNAKLLSFSDAKDGYRRRMQKWSDSNPFEITEHRRSFDDVSEEIPIAERKSVKRAISVFCVGTFISAGLRLISGSAWAWLAELPALILSGKVYADGEETDKLKLQQMREQCADYIRKDIVKDVENKLGCWFDSAEIENARILKSFDIE